ncbi:hypothetical protein SAMN04489834_1471 [Microterricola viridarii]|uniref:Uncharacterized protein n=1 Tax=Microterricola viridarii TaxID=412690 RepID=A0A1H1S653_9MICO|nr:hypothetical protein SAMN04489834_1471 [Microterricola viridarii]
MTRVPGMRDVLRRVSIAGAALAVLSGLTLAGSLTSELEFQGSDRGFASTSVGAEGAEGDKERADADDGLPAARAVDPPGLVMLHGRVVEDADAARFVTMTRSRGPPLPAAVKTTPRESGSWGIHPYPQNG